jgi:hypothetical protein
MPEMKKKKRVQMNSEQKRTMIKKIKQNGSDENLKELASEWNAENPDRQIHISHMQRLKDVARSEDESADEFWASVCVNVDQKVKIEGSSVTFEPPTDKKDHTGRVTQVLDAEKVPLITKEQMDPYRFDFEQEKYTKIGPGSSKKLRSEFRDHFNSKGMVFAPFRCFIGKDERQNLEGELDECMPSETDGIWKTVSDVVLTQEFKKHARVKGKTFSDEGTTEDRINPKYGVLKTYFGQKASHCLSALSRVLLVCEVIYRTVATLLPTNERKDSRRRTYGIMPELNPESLCLLTAVSKRTRVQREHMDDTFRGVSGLWGLVNGQYVIVWLGSYEMNLELERISIFYKFVISKKPAGWTDAAFWNLVAGVHLENQVHCRLNSIVCASTNGQHCRASIRTRSVQRRCGFPLR